jgi:hypothetical protein
MDMSTHAGYRYAMAMEQQMPARKAIPSAKNQFERKTGALSIRIDPRIRYGLELLSRVQRRNVTGVVEWAMQEAFSRETIADADGDVIVFAQAVRLLWADNELERIFLLHFYFPTLLDFDESRMVNVLLSTPNFWKSSKSESRRDKLASFMWADVLHAWETLRPVLTDVASRPTITKLSDDDLKRSGLEQLIVPF